MKFNTMFLWIHIFSGKNLVYFSLIITSQPAFTCSKLTIETLEQGAKYVQS